MVAGVVSSAAVPGAPAWDAVVGDRFIAALLAPAPDACLSAFATAAADERVTIESLVGLVPLGGAHPVESFALVWWPGPDTSEVTAVVRGDAVVDLTSPGGTRRFDARGIRPWHLAEFGAVVGIRITAPDAPLGRLGEAPDLVQHARASLRASAVEWAARAMPSRPDASAADADTVLMHRGQGVPRAGDDRTAAADTILTPGRAAAPGTAPIPTTDAELAGRAPRPLGSDLVAGPPTTTVPVDLRDVIPFTPAPAEGLPGVVSSASPSESTPTGSGMADVPGAPPAAAPAFDVPAFRVGGGAPHPITGPVLIGRRPLAPRIPDVHGAAPELVAVPSPHAVVSGTHLELRLEGSRLVATDLRSTNGTIVRSASGSRRMRAGESIVVAQGTSLDLGDDTIIEILPAPAAPPE